MTTSNSTKEPGASTQPQDTVARIQQAMQAGVPVPIPGALEVRARPPTQFVTGASPPRVDVAAAPPKP